MVFFSFYVNATFFMIIPSKFIHEFLQIRKRGTGPQVKRTTFFRGRCASSCYPRSTTASEIKGTFLFAESRAPLDTITSVLISSSDVGLSEFLNSTSMIAFSPESRILLLFLFVVK
jgi:hypothetical protein